MIESSSLNSEVFNKPFSHPMLKGCMSCPNHGSCALLRNSVSKLDAGARDPHAYSPFIIKKIRILMDHLYRQKFAFPEVMEMSTCWFHNKFGVVESLIDYASELLNSKDVA